MLNTGKISHKSRHAMIKQTRWISGIQFSFQIVEFHYELKDVSVEKFEISDCKTLKIVKFISA